MCVCMCVCVCARTAHASVLDFLDFSDSDYHANSTYHFNEMDLVIAPNALSSLQYKTTHVCPKGTEHIKVADLEPIWTELQNTPLRHISFLHGIFGSSVGLYLEKSVRQWFQLTIKLTQYPY